MVYTLHWGDLRSAGNPMALRDPAPMHFRGGDVPPSNIHPRHHPKPRQTSAEDAHGVNAPTQLTCFIDEFNKLEWWCIGFAVQLIYLSLHVLSCFILKYGKPFCAISTSLRYTTMYLPCNMYELCYCSGISNSVQIGFRQGYTSQEWAGSPLSCWISSKTSINVYASFCG